MRKTGVSTKRLDALRAAEEALWAAVRETTGHSHEVLGELARDPGGQVAILARSLATGSLVVLTRPLRPQAGGGAAPTIVEHLDLGSPVPAPPEPCRACGTPFADWDRRCAVCAAEETAVLPGAGPGQSRDELLESVRTAATGQFDVLGDLPRARDGALVYFGRESSAGRLAVLRLLREPASSGSASQAFVLAATPCAPSPAAGGDDAATLPAAPPATSGDFSKVCPQCGAMYGSVLKFCPADGAGLRSLASPTDLIGQVIADRFFVTDKLGEGGMGEVYLAEHVQLGRRCALKVMRRELLDDADAAARFRREAMNASGISHPNVATIFDFVEAPDGFTYLVMEYVDGESLSDLLAREGALAPWRAAVICRQVAGALGAAHDLGIVHRDLKPDNVMVSAGKDGRERVKVVDFGIAKAVESAQQQVTRTGFLIGTPAFMSPEQLVGDPIDGRSDLYSLGCILYEMLTGRRAFEGSFNVASIARRLDAHPPRPRELDERIPAPLDEIVARLLARSADDRYASALVVVEALAPIAADAPITLGGTSGVGLTITGVEVRPYSGSGGLAMPPTPKSPAVARAKPTAAAEARDRAAAALPTDAARVRRSLPAGLHWLGAAIVLVGVSLAAWQLSSAGDAGAPVPVSPVAADWLPAGGADGAGSDAPPGASGPVAEDRGAPAAGVPVGDAGSGAAPPTDEGSGTAADRALVSRARDRASSARREAVNAGATPSDLATGDAVMQRASALADGGRSADAVRQLESAEASYSAALGILAVRRDSIADALARQQAAGQPVGGDPEASRDTAALAPPPVSGPGQPPPAADPRALDRAQVSAVRDVVARYVQAFSARDVQTLRQLFPGLPAGTERSMREATEWSATLAGEPSVTVTGASAVAEFAYVLQYHLPSTGRQRQTVPLRATFQRSGDAWTIQQLSAAR
ncbi:MAG TPA: protein kinase [Gemmatimonadaceae bacterium]|nr:protein kinase [Gemmatimonadaceae bacterium]